LPQDPVDLEAQAQLTAQLARARPRYESVAEDALVAAIQASLGVPVALLGSGPTSREFVQQARRVILTPERRGRGRIRDSSARHETRMLRLRLRMTAAKPHGEAR
jgi:hypothetical protein